MCVALVHSCASTWPNHKTDINVSCSRTECPKGAQAGERLHFNGSWCYGEATKYTAAPTTTGCQNGAAAALHHPPGDAAADISFAITPFVSLQFYNHFYVVSFLQSTFSVLLCYKTSGHPCAHRVLTLRRPHSPASFIFPHIFTKSLQKSLKLASFLWKRWQLK